MGSGGYGTVYEATTKGEKRAIKFIKVYTGEEKHINAYTEREAENLQKVHDCPFIVKFYDF